ncbi:hypothetical protein [Chachezhania sediminis]|uniref:hypothetical protein n=1 Tax=Chachezhania sediminis TaxID=2599291 RepID=UPI00131D33EE|nr:hypothetical protein [Chachezhania sediminis]
MSYYEHATLLALRLGPWAGPEEPARSTIAREIEAAFTEKRQHPDMPTTPGKRTTPFDAVAAVLGLQRRPGHADSGNESTPKGNRDGERGR